MHGDVSVRQITDETWSGGSVVVTCVPTRIFWDNPVQTPAEDTGEFQQVACHSDVCNRPVNCKPEEQRSIRVWSEHGSWSEVFQSVRSGGVQ